jgi:hypothetical protein
MYANKTKMRAYLKRWRRDNPKLVAAQRARWRKRHPDYQRLWRRRNPAKVKAYKEHRS